MGGVDRNITVSEIPMKVMSVTPQKMIIWSFPKLGIQTTLGLLAFGLEMIGLLTFGPVFLAL